MKKIFSQAILLSLLPISTFAWGGRGHHAICEAASFLTQEKGLRDYLQAKAHIMGYLCNIPDTHWRDISSEVSRLGGPTHYVDVEILGLSPKDIPLDYKKIIQEFNGKPNPLEAGSTIKSVTQEFGSNWWRADQFYRRAVTLGEKWKQLPAPTNSKEEQDENLEFNKIAYDFMISLGVMGHFVGDNGQPFHSTIDYDGYLSGHGGIHAYYEENLVAYMPANLVPMIMSQAQNMQKNRKNESFLKNEGVLENMRQLSMLSLKDKEIIYKLDKVLKPSEVKKEKGMSLKTIAEREPAEKMYKKFQPIIIKNMARSASLLAQIWDDAYIKAGKPKIAAHKSYKFPHKPDFIAPDYYNIEAEAVKK